MYGPKDAPSQLTAESANIRVPIGSGDLFRPPSPPPPPPSISLRPRVPTRSGDLLSVILRNLTQGGVAEEAAKLHLHLVAEVILEIKESGAVLLE